MDQGLGGMDAGPLAHPFHQVLLDPIRQDVLQALDLGRLFVGDGRHVVAALEDRSSPAGQPVDLAGQLGLEVSHEAGDFLGVVDDQQEVEVIGQHRDGRDVHLVLPLGPPQNAQEDIVERGSGTLEVAPLAGAVGNGDEGAGLRDVA
jgi:hypothetical protein